MTRRKSVEQNTGQLLQKSQRSHRVFLQDGIKGKGRQLPEDPKKSRTLSEILEVLENLLRVYQQMRMLAQIIVGMMVLIPIAGMIALCILVTMLPNGYIGLCSLLTTVVSFIIGRGSAKKKRSELI